MDFRKVSTTRFSIETNIIWRIPKWSADCFNLASTLKFCISAEGNNTGELVLILKEESGSILKWLRENKMIVNPDKFHEILL